MFKNSLRHPFTWLAITWFLFTFAQIVWWWKFSLETLAHSDRLQRMIFWEGLALVAALVIGGGFLIFLTIIHQARHERMKFFFSTFAHDIKTSISRIRLQTELMQETPGEVSKDKLNDLFENVHRLDLQLENSLWMAQLNMFNLYKEKVSISEAIELIRNEFPEMRFQLSNDARVQVDRRAFIVALRNIIQNSKIHGQANEIFFRVDRDAGHVIIQITDNGEGPVRVNGEPGQAILKSSDPNSNGIGLFLSRKLLQRMGGDLAVEARGKFVNRLTLQEAR